MLDISRRRVFGFFGGAAAASCASSPLATYAQQALLGRADEVIE